VSNYYPLESSLRDFLTEPPRQDRFLHDKPTWYQIVACLDVIGDTELALDAFLGAATRPSRGEWYLAIYGALQALVLQQDAVSHLGEALQIGYSPDSTLREIRELRNDAVGHATRRGAAPGRSFSALSRMTLSRDTFTILTTTRDPFENHFHKVELPPLIRNQKTIIAAALAAFLKELQHREGVSVGGD
jgi:hypothetical protein